MPDKYWSKKEPEQEFDPIISLLSEWTDPEEEEEEFRSDFFQGLEGRRRKAAFTLTVVWGATIGLHLVSWGFGAVLGLSGLIAAYLLRMIAAKPESRPEALSERALVTAPSVSLLVSAKNEEAVIGDLVKMLCNLDYPTDKYEVWVIDDHSTDKTPELLDQLAQEYQQLNVLHRPPNGEGGKSGALNQVLPLTKGKIVGVFDADAKVTSDLLRRVIPLFDSTEVGAVQVRKAIANAPTNFWTKGQMAEMAVDSYFQQQRIAIGGIGELRGNGQFARRCALTSCGGWNEYTITDDLDLTLRLHLDGWKVGCLMVPAVEEEGVTNAISLWHQRNRWAEGGYQRYLDYWRLIASNRLSFSKKLDLLIFVLMQYLLPTAAIPDFLMAIVRDRLLILSPLTVLMFSVSFWGMYVGLLRTRPDQKLSLSTLLKISWQSLRGMVYMLHWLVVMPCITARMSVRPKRLKWVKTVHEGATEESFEF